MLISEESQEGSLEGDGRDAVGPQQADEVKQAAGQEQVPLHALAKIVSKLSEDSFGNAFGARGV